MNLSGECGRRIQIYRRRQIVERRVLRFQQHEIRTLFDELIHKPWEASRWNPPVDVRESEDVFTIDMDLPGVKDDDVHILVEGNSLTIEGQRALSPCDDVRTVHLCERPDGRFVRSFEFGEDIENRNIESRWQDGVLTVTVPKPSKEKE